MYTVQSVVVADRLLQDPQDGLGLLDGQSADVHIHLVQKLHDVLLSYWGQAFAWPLSVLQKLFVGGRAAFDVVPEPAFHPRRDGLDVQLAAVLADLQRALQAILPDGAQHVDELVPAEDPGVLQEELQELHGRLSVRQVEDVGRSDGRERHPDDFVTALQQVPVAQVFVREVPDGGLFSVRHSSGPGLDFDVPIAADADVYPVRRTAPDDVPWPFVEDVSQGFGKLADSSGGACLILLAEPGDALLYYLDHSGLLILVQLHDFFSFRLIRASRAFLTQLRCRVDSSHGAAQ